MNMSSPNRFSLAATTAALALLLSSPLAHADTLTWATSAAGTWDTTTTSAWNPGPVAWSTASTDVAAFGGSAATYTVAIANNTAISAGGITVSTGNNVTINGGTGSTFTLSGSAIDGAGNLTFGLAVAGSSGLVKSNAGILRFKATSTYTGDTTFSGGQITLEANNGIGSSGSLAITGASTLSLQGKNQSVAGLSGASTAIIRTTSGNATSTLTITGGSGTFAGTLTNSGVGALLAITNSGGSLTLSGTNTYNGATIVSGGTLTLGSNLANTASVTVSGGTLASNVAAVNLGAGAFSLTSGALSANGASIGTFTIAANQAFSATLGTLNFTLGASNTSDQIIGSGTGALSLTNLTLALNGSTSVTGSYTLFTGFGGTHTISGITITGLDSGYTGILDNNGILTVSFSAVPEPSTWALLIGVTALGFTAVRRRTVRA